MIFLWGIQHDKNFLFIVKSIDRPDFPPRQNEVSLLRNEVAHLKQLLLAHKDCPVTTLQKKNAYLGEPFRDMPCDSPHFNC